LVEILDHEVGPVDNWLALSEGGEGREPVHDGSDFGIGHPIADCEYRTGEAHIADDRSLPLLLGQE
jgi:hypothetical protein